MEKYLATLKETGKRNWAKIRAHIGFYIAVIGIFIAIASLTFAILIYLGLPSPEDFFPPLLKNLDDGEYTITVQKK